MAKVLILFAHPGQQHSRINTRAASVAATFSGTTFVDLYAEYPRFKIDIDREQKALVAHDAIIMQFPLYWYSTPSLLKEWQDLVLEFGFAYGPGGDALKGKLLLPVITAGGAETAYQADGQNNFLLRTLLAPLEQTANLCQMQFIPPLVLFGAHQAGKDGRDEQHIAQYRTIVSAISEDRFDIKAARERSLLTDGPLPVRESI